MIRIKRLMALHRLNAPATGGEGGSGGGNGGGAGEGGEGAGAGEGGEGGEGEGEGTGEGDGEDADPTDAQKPKLSDNEAKLLKENMAKKKALAKATADLKAFEGIDPEKARAALKAQAEAATAELEAKGAWDALKSQMVTAHATETAALKAELDAEKARAAAAAAQIAELTVGGAFATSQFVQNELTLPVNKARQSYGAHFEFVDGVIVAFDKPANAASRTQLVGADGEPLAFEAALKKLVDLDPDRDALLKSKIKPGSNSRPSAPGTKTPQGEDQGRGAARIANLLKGGVKV